MGVTIFRPGQRLVIPGTGVQVWSPRGASVAASGILDGISNVAAAYSLRKLRSAYAGSAVRVRRSSDSTEQDIGFDGTGEFDSVAFSSFVGGGTGYVKTWYDQSGNGANATQATAANQPIIVLSVVNGKPAILFSSATATHLTLGVPSAINFAPSAAYSLFCCYKWGSGAGYVITKFSAAAAAPFAILGQATTVAYGQPYFTSTTNGANHANAMIVASVVTPATTGAGAGRRNGGTGTSLTRGSSDTTANGIDYLVGGRRGANNTTTAAHFDGYAGDILILSTAITAADHNTIGADMATRYGLSWTTVT